MLRLDVPCCGVVEFTADPVGSGSTGHVYLGLLQPSALPVALKATAAAPSAARGWHRELRAVRPLLRKPHRNVLTYHAAYRYAGETLRTAKGKVILEPGAGVLVMERAWKVPLPVQQRPEGLAWCAERGWRLQQAAWAAKVLVSGANALHWLHQVIRTIHRDLKLENLFLSEDGVLKLGDFSASKTQLYDRQKAKTRQGIGTTGSMAPELYFRSMGYTAAVDVWSLGCVTVDAFSGSLPYEMDAFLRVVTYGQLKSGAALRLSQEALATSEELSAGVRELQESIHRRLSSWLPQDDGLCQDLCSVLIKLLTPVPEQRPSSPEILQLPEMQRLAKRVKDELDEPMFHPEGDLGDLQAHLIHRALDRLESLQDLELLREDVHRAVLSEDPHAPQLLQMLLQLPTFRGAEQASSRASSCAGPGLPGWAHPAQDALCRSWNAADFKDLRELLLCLQDLGLPIATWPPGSAEELLRELGRGSTTLSLRKGPESQVISIAHELCLDLRQARQDSGASELCLLELHSLDATADGRVVFPQLRHRLPTWLFDPKDGLSWSQRLHEALDALQLAELVEEEEDFAVPESSLEFRPSQSFPGLWTRHHRWTLRLSALASAGSGAFNAGRRRWAWLAPEESCALRRRQQQMGVGQVRYEDLCKVSEEGQTLLHAACVSRHAARLLRLVSDLLPYVQVSRQSLSDFLPLEAQDPQGRTPLWLAASRADRKAVQQLLHFRSDPEATDRRGVSVLAAAAETRRDQTIGTVKELLEGGAMPMEVLKKLDKEERSDVLSNGILKVLVKSALAGTVWRRIAECIMTLAGGKVGRSYLEEILHRCQVDVLVAKHLLAMLEGVEEVTSEELWKRLSTVETCSRRKRSREAAQRSDMGELQALEMRGYPSPSPKASETLSPKTVRTASDLSEHSPKVALSESHSEEAVQSARQPQVDPKRQTVRLEPRRSSIRRRSFSEHPHATLSRHWPPVQAETTAAGRMHSFKGIRPRYLDHLSLPGVEGGLGLRKHSLSRPRPRGQRTQRAEAR